MGYICGVCNTLLTFSGAHIKKTIPFWLLPSLDCRWLLFIASVTFNNRNFKLIFVGGNFSRYYQNKMILLLSSLCATFWLAYGIGDSISLSARWLFFTFHCNTMPLCLQLTVLHTLCLFSFLFFRWMESGLWFTVMWSHPSVVVLSQCLTSRPDNDL